MWLPWRSRASHAKWLLSSCRSVRVRRAPSPPRWLRHVNEILRCRFKESLRLGEISREVGMHPVHVAREFHRYYGTTIGQFRRQCRIDFACDRLVHSKLPIVEIAFESGFAQQPHFTNVFKRITGLTPCRYRKLHTTSSASSEAHRPTDGPRLDLGAGQLSGRTWRISRDRRPSVTERSFARGLRKLPFKMTSSGTGPVIARIPNVLCDARHNSLQCSKIAFGRK